MTVTSVSVPKSFLSDRFQAFRSSFYLFLPFPRSLPFRLFFALVPLLHSLPLNSPLPISPNPGVHAYSYDNFVVLLFRRTRSGQVREWAWPISAVRIQSDLAGFTLVKNN